VPTAKQRREAERRRLQRRAQRRAHQEARRRRYALIASIVGTLLVIGIVITFVVVTSDEDDKTTGSGGNEALCTWTKGGTAAKAVTLPPTTNPSHKGTVAVSVQTSQGAMTFTLNRAKAPCTVESFVSLAEQHYYDSTSCHRLTTGTLNVLQCGDPNGDGSGGPGYSVGDELTGKEKYTRGVLAMANSGVNTNGSQFFIVYKNSTLAPNYTIFGTVSSGLSVVDKVAAAGSDNSKATGDGKPKLPITLTSLTVAN
jgi:peptidyl-prolyl cis-trans isomerase B (cyclophilin B)